MVDQKEPSAAVLADDAEEEAMKKNDKDEDGDGEVVRSNIFVWGDNSHGQLSIDEQTANVQDPIAITLSQVSSIKSVACGRSHTLIVNDAGLVFAMGDNSYGQLGLPTVVMRASRQPILVESVGALVAEVYCAANSSFALVKVSDESDQQSQTAVQSDELYSWGATKEGILGRDISSKEIASPNPGKVEFPADASISDGRLEIQQVSVGESHAALLTTDHKVLCWGANSKGELGLGDTDNRPEPTLNVLVEGADTIKVSCGDSFTFLISGLNEIMIAGNLPFAVQTEQGEEQDFIAIFQSIAQFDARVNILQVEASRFASIVVDPVEEGQPKELFLWGQSPLGVFNELTPLNLLSAGSYEQSEEAQTFNVTAVKNGLNFCVFVDSESGMTYQVGAENMIDPYVNDALVSLSELRDAQFGDLLKYACGHNFVIGESTIEGDVLHSSPQKKHNFRPQSPIKEVSQNVETEQEIELSMQLVSPDASKQSFPQRALYQGSISPSTPTENTSLRSYSGLKSMQWRHRDLVGALKHVEGCRPVLSGTPKVTAKHQDRNTGFATVAGTKPADESAQAVDRVLNTEQQFNKTAEHQMSTNLPQEIVEEAQQPSGTLTAGNMCQEDDQDVKTPIVPDDSEKFLTQMKSAQQPTFSADISPINGQMQDVLRDSQNENEHHWMDKTCPYGMLSNEKVADYTKLSRGGDGPGQESQDQRNLYDESVQKSRQNFTSNQMPLQMQENSHVVYQAHPQILGMGGADMHQSVGVARYLPLQQHQNMMQGQLQQEVQYHPVPHNLAQQKLSQQFTTLNQSQVNMSGFLNMSQAAALQPIGTPCETSFYELIMKDKLDGAQLSGQLKEAQRQLDKSRREYAKLLSQVDEDQEETAALKAKARQQEASLGEMTIKVRDQEVALEKIGSERTKLEAELKQTSKANQTLQVEFQASQIKVKELESLKQKCNSDACKKNTSELELQTSRKSKQIYELTVKLGCIESENLELKVQLQEKNSIYDSCLDSSRFIAEQDLQDAQRQISELTDALSQSNQQIGVLQFQANQKAICYDQGVQTTKSEQMPRSCQNQSQQTGDSDGLDFPHFVHTQSIEEKQPTMLQIPTPVFEVINYQSRVAEAEQSFDTSISLHNEHLEQQEDPSNTNSSSISLLENCHDVLHVAQQEEEEEDSLPDQVDYQSSLREFRSNEKAAAAHGFHTQQSRSSMEAPRNSVGSRWANMAQKVNPCNSSTKKSLQTINTSSSGHNLVSRPKQHNFLVNSMVTNRVPIVNYEPKIMRKSAATNLPNKTLRLQHNTSASHLADVKQQRLLVDQNRSANYATNFPDLKEQRPLIDNKEDNSHSLINLGEQSNDVEQSWQTFKPSVVCPNERYSLKRHQEIFIESQFSQASADEGEMSNSNFGGAPANNHVPQEKSADQQQLLASQRRAKSSSEIGGGSQAKTATQKTRRLRHQRKTNQIVKQSDTNESCGDMISQRSFGVKSNMTTPMKTDRTGLNQRRPVAGELSIVKNYTTQLADQTSNDVSFNHERHSGSQLKHPTRLSKSPNLKATLREIDRKKQVSVQNNFCSEQQIQAQNSSQNNQNHENIQPCQTPIIRSNQSNGAFFASKRNSANLTARPQIYQTLSTNANEEHHLNRPSVITGGQQLQQSTLYQSQSQNNLKMSATPRVKSQSTMYGHHAGNLLGRKDSSATSQHASATARRVAYDARRRTAQMKQMTKAATHGQQLQACQINRQARMASGLVEQRVLVKQGKNFVAQNGHSISVMEEPLSCPPEQAYKPEISVNEDSELPTLMSARNLVPSTLSVHSTNENDRSFGRGNPALTERGQMSQTMHLTNNQQRQNPFFVSATNTLDAVTESTLTMEQLAKAKNNFMTQSNYTVAEENRSSTIDDPSHLNDMKDKLYKIQSNKQQLERKIQEYESKLKKISKEKSTQEIYAKAQQQIQSQKQYNSCSTDRYDNSSIIQYDQNGSTYTLGETKDRPAAAKHTHSTAEHKQRAAFQQLNNVVNMQKSNQSHSSHAQQQSNLVGSKSYRDCLNVPVQAPQQRIKAQPSIMPRTHHVNQNIFRR